MQKLGRRLATPENGLNAQWLRARTPPPQDGTLVAMGTYALHYGKALPGLPNFMEVKPAKETANAGIWNPENDTCEQVWMGNGRACVQARARV